MSREASSSAKPFGNGQAQRKSEATFDFQDYQGSRAKDWFMCNGREVIRVLNDSPPGVTRSSGR